MIYYSLRKALANKGECWTTTIPHMHHSRDIAFDTCNTASFYVNLYFLILNPNKLQAVIVSMDN